MFRQTLGGAARNWFDDLDPKNVDSFEELSQKFLEEFSQQKRYAKDPTEIHSIKRRQNKGLQAFMDRFKSESSHIKGVPPVLHILAFMHSHGHPKLAKKLNDKIPKTMDEMFERVRAFIRGEVVAGSVKMVPPSQGDKGYIRPEIKSEGSLSTVEVRQKSCMNIASETSMSTSGQDLEDAKFRWTGMRSLGAVGSTIHSMIKFPINQGIVTMETSREALWECKQLERVQGSWKEIQWHQREEQMSRIREQVILRTKNSSG
ncbi:reverse transcriptase domain-containing protein [Tanacetum coccineum]|uniref:Reverse transcriptase domain-containing protein n=1 Tax=Tanacetum coccineum TaxID=301880 RepID=A0ABQ4WUA5_9ASTR